MTILNPQTNNLINTKVPEDTIERIENDNTTMCTRNGTNRKVSRKAMNI